jgi:hypothetical protein
MYIYQNYKNKKDLQNSIKNNNLHKGYYFAFNNSIYQMINDKDYIRVNYFIFENDSVRKQVERIADLKYQDGDIIKIQSR